MVETQKSIHDWALATFGEIKNIETIHERLMQEVEEYDDIILSGDYTKAVDEMADCLIVLYQVASTLGVDLHEAVNRKMDINRRRKWKLHGDGTAQHID